MPMTNSMHLVEQRPIGTVRGNFLTREDFLSTCRHWLKNSGLHHVVTLNPEMVMLAETNPAFRQAVNAAQLRVPDGAGLIWARWYLRSAYWGWLPSLIAFMWQPSERITGVDTINNLSRLCMDENHSLYLLGGTAAQVTKTAAKLRSLFPKLNVMISPDHVYDLSGPTFILEDLRAKQPAVLLVAYGAPKQTRWIEKHRDQLPSVRIAVGVGGAFAIIGEERPRAPRWLRQLNLEWIWRLIQEPSRLPRIWQAAVSFPWLIKKQKAAERQSGDLRTPRS